MNKPEIDPSLPFDQQLKAWYEHLDGFINAEEKNKSTGDVLAWAGEINHTILEPIETLFKNKFQNQAPVKIQLLDLNPKVKKDDHIKRLKANRYNIFTYQRKIYLEQVGDLS